MAYGNLSPRWARRLINIWPPFAFAGIRVRSIAPDWSRVEVELRLRWWNRNAVGTMFGGSLFSMVDPFYPLMLQHALGADYVIFTRSAEIEFLSPGRKLARASFAAPHEEIERLRAGAASGRSAHASFVTEIVDGEGVTLARVASVVYARRRRDPAVEARLSRAR